MDTWDLVITVAGAGGLAGVIVALIDWRRNLHPDRASTDLTKAQEAKTIAEAYDRVLDRLETTVASVSNDLAEQRLRGDRLEASLERETRQRQALRRRVALLEERLRAAHLPIPPPSSSIDDDDDL